MTLSVLSALTRLNIDPWDEAAQLCELPKHAAAARLCSLIARLPAGSWAHADCQAIAEHLIEFLPHRSSSPQDARGSHRINLSGVPIIIAVALGLAALLIAASCEPSRADGMNQGQSPFQTWHGYPTFARLMAKGDLHRNGYGSYQCARPPRICRCRVRTYEPLDPSLPDSGGDRAALAQAVREGCRPVSTYRSLVSTRATSALRAAPHRSEERLSSANRGTCIRHLRLFTPTLGTAG
jgi:hypothetical protein